MRRKWEEKNEKEEDRQLITRRREIIVPLRRKSRKEIFT
jgi:hypothetical protein